MTYPQLGYPKGSVTLQIIPPYKIQLWSFPHFYYIINLINFRSCNKNKDNSNFKFGTQFNILTNL
jgi:hypothetical protein